MCYFNFRLIVALLNQIHVFAFPTPTQRLFTLETRENYRGLCEVSPLASAEKQILVFPGHKIGSVQLVVRKLSFSMIKFALKTVGILKDLSCTEMSISNAPVWIAAHKSEIGCIALNQQGTRLATASNKGTLIRVWDTTTKNQLVELRRGSDPATVYWLVKIVIFV